MVGHRQVGIEAHIASIRAIETKSDAVVRQIFLSANRTFNAPIDREDILALAHELDDVVDLIEDTAKGIQRYALTVFPEEMQTMVNAVVESAELLKKAVPFLDSITRDHRQIYALCQRIGQIEEHADESFDAALSRIRSELREGQLRTSCRRLPRSTSSVKRPSRVKRPPRSLPPGGRSQRLGAARRH